jgi:lipopolysaccharide export system permease protein
VIIFRYLSKEILRTMLAATLVLLVLFVTNQSLQFLQRAASGQLPPTELLRLISLQIPLLLGYLLPLGLYLGILLTLGRMHLESEMTVLSACGISRAKLTGMVFLIAILVASIVMWLMAFVVPRAQGDMNRIISTAAASASVEQVIPNRFMTFGKKHDKQIVFYASSVENHQILHHVFLAQSEKNPKSAEEEWGIVTANSAEETTMPATQNHYLVFNEGYRYSGTPGEKDYRVMKFQQYGSQLMLGNVETPNKVQYYSIPKLWSLSPHDIDAAAELQWRFAMPLSALIFALLAMPLSEVRPRYGKFTQLFPAMIIYLSYGDLIFLCRSWISGAQISPALGMWWVHASVLIIAIVLTLYRFGWSRMTRLLPRGAR